MLRTAPSHCYIVELDTFPGIWRVVADLKCELDSFFYFFSMGKWGLQAWWGVQQRKNKELSSRTMKSATLLCWGHLAGETLGLSADVETPCFVSAGSWTPPVSMFLSDECSPVSSVACRNCHASKGASQMAVPTLQYQVTLEAWGAQPLAWNASPGLEFWCGWSFSLYLPASLLLQVRS